VNFPILHAIEDAIQAAEEENLEPKRVEISRKFHHALKQEFQDMLDISDETGNVKTVKGVDVEIREDHDRFRVIAEYSETHRPVRILHGEEYLYD